MRRLREPARPPTAPGDVPAIVTNKDSSSIAQKPVDNLSRNRVARTDEKFDDPWMRGLMLTASVQNSLVVTQVGDADVKTLAQHMQKPASALVMTFSADPLDGHDHRDVHRQRRRVPADHDVQQRVAPHRRAALSRHARKPFQAAAA